MVTGASTGIGLAFARLLADEGHDLVIAADEPEIEQVATELRRTGRDVRAVQVDLAEHGGVEQLHRAVLTHPSPVTVGILNAGIGVHGRFHEVDLAQQLKVVDLNVRSTVHLASLLTRDMVAGGGGRLLMVSSIAGMAPGPGHAAYAASKAFVHSYAEAARAELADTGITVTSLLPGPTDTAFFARADMEHTVVGRGPKDSAERVARDGYDAMVAGKDKVIAGRLVNTLMAKGSGIAPDVLATQFAATQTKPLDR